MKWYWYIGIGVLLALLAFWIGQSDIDFVQLILSFVKVLPVIFMLGLLVAVMFITGRTSYPSYEDEIEEKKKKQKEEEEILSRFGYKE